MISESILKVERLGKRDSGKGIAELSRETAVQLGINIGDVIEVKGGKLTSATVRKFCEEGGVIRIDEFLMRNCAAKVGDCVRVRKAAVKEGDEVVLAPVDKLNVDDDFVKFIKNHIKKRTIVEGNVLLVEILGHPLQFLVLETSPKGIVQIVDKTKLRVLSEALKEQLASFETEKTTQSEQKAESFPLIQVGKVLAVIGVVLIGLSSVMSWIKTIPIPLIGSISASLLDFMPKSLTPQGFNAFISIITKGSKVAVEDAVLGLLFAGSVAFIIAIISGVASLIYWDAEAMELAGWVGVAACVFIAVLCTSYVIEWTILGITKTINPLQMDAGLYTCAIGSILMIIAGYIIKKEKAKTSHLKIKK